MAFELVFDVGDHQIGANSHPNVDFDGVFRCAPQRLYLQILFYPLEEEFDLPAIFVEQGNVLCRYVEVVGQKDKREFLFAVVELDPPQFFGIAFPAVITCEDKWSGRSASLLACRPFGSRQP